LKKVLIITYHFPPRATVGSLRPSGLARYLPEFGWEPVILTAKLPGSPPPESRVIETDYHDKMSFGKRILGIDPEQNVMTQVAQLKSRLHIKGERSILDFLLARWGEITAYPDPQKGWRPTAVKSGHDILQKESIDAIISTSSPPTCHIIANELKKRHSVPWIADFRDLWTQNHYYPYSRLRRSFEARLEQRTLQHADALVTVSEPLAHELGERHKGKTIHVVANGFNPNEINMPEANLTDKFTITYTGNLYPGKQSPEPLFAALKYLTEQNIVDSSKIEVRFYGAEAGWVKEQVKRYGLDNIVRQYGILTREAALDKQRESQLLLLLKWNDPSQKGVYQAKLFEYLAARRPILAVGNYHDVVSDLLIQTRVGISTSTPEELIEAVKKFYQEYREAGGIAYRGLEKEVGEYSQRETTGKFVDVLNKISGCSSN